MKRQITLLMMIASISFFFPEEFVRYDQELQVPEGKIVIYVRYINSKYEIVDSFYAFFENEPDRKLVYFEKCVIYDKNGKPILDLRNYNPPLYGYRMKLSYPKNKKFSPGLILDPYFGSKDRVGDSQEIEWDSRNKTFYKRKSLVP